MKLSPMPEMIGYSKGLQFIGRLAVRENPAHLGVLSH